MQTSFSTRWSANHWTPSTSRWLVGSSSTSESRVCTRAAANDTGAARRRTGPRQGCPEPRVVDADAVEHRPHAGVTGPTRGWPGRVTDHGLAHGVGREFRALGDHLHPQVAHPGHAPGVGLGDAGEDLNRVVLPPPLRPTTPMRSPALTPRRRCRVPGGCRGDRTLLDVDEVVGAISTFLWGRRRTVRCRRDRGRGRRWRRS